MPNADNPYGVTTYISLASRVPLTQLITDMQAFGLTWWRCQYPMSSIDNPQGTYTWTGLDAAVAAANAASINIIFAFMQAPSWGVDGTTGLPTPAYTTTIAALIAARYNGLTGHGTLDAIEVWNEEFDSSSYNNTTYGAVANAGYTAIRGAGFVGKIGCASMLGISSTGHVTTWVNQLYTSSIAGLFDYLSLHYYNGPNDPSTIGSFISFPLALSTINAALTANSDASKPLWVTEFGYATSTNGGHSLSNVISVPLQAQFYDFIVNTARKNSRQNGAGCIEKIMFYTMDTDVSNVEGESITQGLAGSETSYPAATNLTHYTQTFPTWPGLVRFGRFMSH